MLLSLQLGFMLRSLPSDYVLLNSVLLFSAPPAGIHQSKPYLFLYGQIFHFFPVCRCLWIVIERNLLLLIIAYQEITWGSHVIFNFSLAVTSYLFLTSTLVTCGSAFQNQESLVSSLYSCPRRNQSAFISF